MCIHMSYEEKVEVIKTIQQGDDEVAVKLIKKFAQCNSNEAKEWVIRHKRHVILGEEDLTETEY